MPVFNEYDDQDYFETRALDPEVVCEELRMLVRTGRMGSMWNLSPEEAFALVGIGEDLHPGVWADIDWYGPLEIWRDPEHDVSDILFNGRPDEPFFVVQRGVMLDTGVVVHPDWIEWIQTHLLVRSRKVHPWMPDWPEPMMQGVVDRLRYAITQEPASRHGGSLAIRLLPERWRTLDDLVQADMITREATELLLAALRSGASVLISGATGSGKTTLTAGLTDAIGRTMRLVFIEDGGELPHTHNSLHIEVADPSAFSHSVKFALRQKPNFIIVGEVRGGEAMAMLQAAATGHPGIGTIHAGGVQGALRNLERMAMLGLAAEAGGGGQAAAQIVRGLITSDVVNLIVVHVGRSSRGRRSVLAIEEVLRQGAQGQSGDQFPTNPLYQFDVHSDRLVRVGHVNGAWGLGRI